MNKKFLIIQTAFIGDVILATALAEQIHKDYPTARIDFVVKKGWQVLLKGHPFIQEVFLLNKSEKFKSLWSLIKQIRLKKYDHVINAHRHGSSGILAAFSGAKEVVGFKKNPMSFLFNKKIKHDFEDEKSPHEVDRNYRLIEHLCPEQTEKPRLYPSNVDYLKVNHNRKFITISPATVWYTKQWPMEKWIELIKKIPQSMDVFLLGGPGDKKLCKEIKQKVDQINVIDKSGTYNLLESAALMEKAVMNYTNDSAPLHISTAMNAPTGAVFCSTSPKFGYGPLADVSYVFETDEDLDCKPCGVHGHVKCPKGDFRCINIRLDKLLEPLNKR